MQSTNEYTLPVFSVSASVISDPGCVRETNEDNGRHVTPFARDLEDSHGTLTIIADGMGGHNSGEVASQMAIDLISRSFYADVEGSIPDRLERAIQNANSEINAAAMADRKYFGMGTTVVALVLHGDVGYCAHIGDSRLYRLRDEEMDLLTMDHSQVMEMVKQGILTFDQAQDHEDKNIILRAVGTQPFVEVEMSEPFDVKPDDEFLLCSDGLCDMVRSEEIREIWITTAQIHSTVEQLIDLAKLRGGTDNITVAVVRVSARAQTQVAKIVPVTRETKVQR
ncbi:MAG TPA: Stp1/IreP family PP2C-type Ser/Thr phosphatase [Pyrinomonadaceae bacterium]|nr:Stp1/IreP family PP2C-type Ser/Thr phosphatase [Pyrinomonadaceae bacterium]